MRHCGECVPCLVRRAAFLKAGLKDDTENGYCVEPLKSSDSQDVAAAAMTGLKIGAGIGIAYCVYELLKW